MTAGHLRMAIAGPLPDAAGRETSPLGVLTIDEFGTPDTPLWPPREGLHGVCAWGRPLAELQDAFWAEWPNVASRVKGATFGCGPSGRQSHGKALSGKWLVFQEPRRRAGQP